jgi:general secretion pathway protein D
MKLNLAHLIVAGSTGIFITFGGNLPAAAADDAAVNQPSSKAAAKPNVAREEILIEAVVFEVTLNGSNDTQLLCFGNSDAQSEGPSSHTQTGASNAFTGLRATEGDLGSMMTNLASNKQVRILQRPRIQTTDGVAASMFVGDSRYCSRVPQNEAGEDCEKHSLNEVLGLTLDISPSITSNRMLQMHIGETIERFAGTTNIANVGKVPITNRQNTETDVTVADRQTIVLAGMIHDTQDKPAKGIPVLKSIPVIGGAFRNHPRKIQVETVLAVRATILPPKQAGAKTNTEQKLRVGG